MSELPESARSTIGTDVPVGDSSVHYDASPRIFELLLDHNMNYSSAIYPRNDEDLHAAQLAKMTKVATWLGLRPGARLLDVGCGWCGPALYFAEHYNVHVTGVTLSPVQRDYGLAWADRRGLNDSLHLEVRSVMEMDYPPASFDAILFLESIIHMPAKGAIFSRCAELLRPGGRVLVQESNYDRNSSRERYRNARGFKEVDQAFGQTGDMVSAGRMIVDLEEADLTPCGLEDISRDYVRTLSQWLINLDNHAAEMRAVSADAYLMLRRYLMIALASYRSGQTLCHMIVAQKRGLR